MPELTDFNVLPNDCLCEGRRATLYVRDPLTPAPADCSAAVWVPHLAVKGDLTINAERGEIDETPRDKDICWNEILPTKGDLSVDGEISCDGSYLLNYAVMQASDCNPVSPTQFMALTDCIDTPGAYGFRGCFVNMQCGSTNPADGSTRLPFSLKPSVRCTDCQCPVEKVFVCPAGNLITPLQTLAAQVQSSGQRRFALNETARNELRRSRLLDQSLLDTRHPEVFVMIDDLVSLMLSMKATPEDINKELLSVTPEKYGEPRLTLLAPSINARGKGYAMVHAAGYKSLLDDVLEASNPEKEKVSIASKPAKPKSE